MHLAYSISLHSTCIERQVGAIITDGKNRVLSIGYNDVPHNCEPCFELSSRCYRKIKDIENMCDICEIIHHCPFCGNDFNFKSTLSGAEPRTITDDMFICNSCHEELSQLLVGNNLAYCRSLHAEENAILLNPFLSNRFFDNELNMTIYSTTFPCMLCAKKIANSGIKKLIFVEPYPMKESYKILKDTGVEIKTFEGVKSLSFNWIFRDRGSYLKAEAFRRVRELEKITEGEKNGKVSQVQ